MVNSFVRGRSYIYTGPVFSNYSAPDTPFCVSNQDKWYDRRPHRCNKLGTDEGDRAWYSFEDIDGGVWPYFKRGMKYFEDIKSSEEKNKEFDSSYIE